MSNEELGVRGIQGKRKREEVRRGRREDVADSAISSSCWHKNIIIQ
jgi:hypothetical protein